MNVTKDVINDLLPLYAANDCSGDTRKLVDDYLQRNPAEAEQLRRIMSAPVPGAAPSPAELDEARSLRKARRTVRRRSFLLGLAIFFSLTPFSFFVTEKQSYWLLLDAPMTALIYGALGVVCWAAYAVARYRLRIL
jgi:hypothetical protein